MFNKATKLLSNFFDKDPYAINSQSRVKDPDRDIDHPDNLLFLIQGAMYLRGLNPNLRIEKKGEFYKLIQFEDTPEIDRLEMVEFASKLEGDYVIWDAASEVLGKQRYFAVGGNPITIIKDAITHHKNQEKLKNLREAKQENAVKITP